MYGYSFYIYSQLLHRMGGTPACTKWGKRHLYYLSVHLFFPAQSRRAIQRLAACYPALANEPDDFHPGLTLPSNALRDP